MPEGDTIYRAARALHKALAGRVVVGFETGLAKIARVNDDSPVVGRVVEKVESRGKWCLMYFSGAPSGGEPLILVTHMLMSGSWHIYRAGEKWWMGKDKMRVAVKVGGMVGEERSFASANDNPPFPIEPERMGHPAAGSSENEGGWQAVAFNVPVVEWHTARSLERNSQVPKLGPDVLDAGFTVEAGVARLRAYGAEHPEAEIAVVLLNQRVLAGLGNVYKSEVAFAAGVNPWRAMRTITAKEMEVMVDASQRYMKANVIDGAGDGIVTYAGNRRTTHSMSKEERLWVYGRQGMECRRCGATVMMRKQASKRGRRIGVPGARGGWGMGWRRWVECLRGGGEGGWVVEANAVN